MRRFLLHAVALGTLCAQSVQTWGGLSFGMTEKQVRSALGSRMLSPGPNDQPTDGSSHLFTEGLVRETAIKGFAGDATLLFDKTSKRLSAIALFLTPLKDSNNLDKSFAYTRLREDLLKKYGSPAERIGCDEGATECHMIFRGKGQSVDARIKIWHEVPIIVYILYEPSGAIKGI